MAVQIGLHGARRKLDLGVANGERFAVMAGTGFDALMIRDAGSRMKNRVGRLAYVWTGVKHLRERQLRLHIRVDGNDWFDSKASCALVGNVGKVLGGISVFDIRLDRKAPYELDGGERKATQRLRIAVEPGAITVCVPEEATA